LFFFLFGFHNSPTSNGDLRGHHPQRPIWVEGINKYNWVLPGAQRGSFTMLAKFHPSVTQPSAQYLTPWLRWFGPVENKTLMSLQDTKCTFGGRGVSQVNSGSVILAIHAVVTRKNHMKSSPLGVASHPTFLPLHMGWSNRFRVLSPKVCGTLSVL
jgi:hypothetical protein